MERGLNPLSEILRCAQNDTLWILAFARMTFSCCHCEPRCNRDEAIHKRCRHMPTPLNPQCRQRPPPGGTRGAAPQGNVHHSVHHVSHHMLYRTGQSDVNRLKVMQSVRNCLTLATGIRRPGQVIVGGRQQLTAFPWPGKEGRHPVILSVAKNLRVRGTSACMSFPRKRESR